MSPQCRVMASTFYPAGFLRPHFNGKAWAECSATDTHFPMVSSGARATDYGPVRAWAAAEA